MTWQEEEIPNGRILFIRVHEVNVIDGEVQPSAFQPHGKGLSTNWKKYCTAQEALSKAREPDRNGVAKMNASAVRRVPRVVRHAPSNSDRSHTNIIGDDSTTVRLNLLKIAQREIPFPRKP